MRQSLSKITSVPRSPPAGCRPCEEPEQVPRNEFAALRANSFRGAVVKRLSGPPGTADLPLRPGKSPQRTPTSDAKCETGRFADRRKMRGHMGRRRGWSRSNQRETDWCARSHRSRTHGKFLAMPRGRHRQSPPLHRLLPPATVAGASIACAAGAWFVGDDLVQRVLAVGAAAAALTGAVLLRTWDRNAGRRVAELTRARLRDEWRTEERIAELETDVEESRELRTALDAKLRAKRAELARLRSEHADLLRRYATAETERASALEGRRLLAIEAATPSRALPAAARLPRALRFVRAGSPRSGPGASPARRGTVQLRRPMRRPTRRFAASPATPPASAPPRRPRAPRGTASGAKRPPGPSRPAVRLRTVRAAGGRHRRPSHRARTGLRTPARPTPPHPRSVRSRPPPPSSHRPAPPRPAAPRPAPWAASTSSATRPAMAPAS